MLYRNIDLNCLWIVLRILWEIWYHFDDSTTWHIGMYINYMMKLYNDFIWWWDVIKTQDGYVVLRVPMVGLLIEAVYGETMIHSTEAVWEILTWEKWLGCYHDTSPMFDIPGSTPVWALYMIFSSFHDIKIYMYYVFKIYMYYKRKIGGFWLHHDPTMFRERFRPPMSFTEKIIHKHTVVLLWVDIKCCFIYDTANLLNCLTPSSLTW